MNNGASILVLADPPAGMELSGRLGPETTFLEDPYDLLLALSDGQCGTVILTAPRPDFEGLCRSARKLQGRGKLLALCSVSAEPEIRSLPAGLLDDYFIYPPTREDLAAIRRAASLDGPAPQAPGAQQYVSERQSGERPARPQAPVAAALNAQDLSRLVTAATSLSSLESAIAELAVRRLSLPARWADADDLPERDQPLLLIPGDVSRALVPQDPQRGPDAASKGLMASIQQYLPALMDNARRIESLHQLAITDHLTGAYNRRYFYHLTDQILLRASQKALRATLLLYDIDDFKHYNETYGHAAGDEILRETAALMKQTSRSHDVVARIGGDEFAALFWDPDRPRTPGSKPLESAFALADRFRSRVSNHSFRSLGPEAKGVLTISGGLASFPEGGATCRDLLRTADHALRAAKKDGKNVIRLIGKEEG